ncbi:MAG: hypothetical protein HC894_17170 [Microcoleus sp. SM1_3_4]|nr:hypothetical protein [Microcoleus sp. SM1_3_4]
MSETRFLALVQNLRSNRSPFLTCCDSCATPNCSIARTAVLYCMLFCQPSTVNDRLSTVKKYT